MYIKIIYYTLIKWSDKENKIFFKCISFYCKNAWGIIPPKGLANIREPTLTITLSTV